MPLDGQYGHWQKTADFIKSQTAKSAGGALKHIHVDTDKQPTKAEQTEGMLYDAEKREAAIHASPALRCPNCNEPACDIVDAVNPYNRYLKDTGGKSYEGAPPKWPLSSPEPHLHFYCVEPCGCRVDHVWAGFFQLELKSRMEGGEPHDLNKLLPGPKAQQARLDSLEADLAKLYALQGSPTTDDAKEAVDYWIVIVADLIQRVCPGQHNHKPTEKPISDKVKAWAGEKGLSTPPVKKNVAANPANQGFLDALTKDMQGSGTSLLDALNPALPKKGQLVYRQPDGTVSQWPAYEGQEPLGEVAGVYNKKTGELPIKKTNKIVFDFSPEKATAADAVVAAAIALAGAGLVYPSNLPLPSGVLPSEPMDEPEITKTKAGQFGVRWGDTYEVFVTEDKAIEFKKKLMSTKTPPVAPAKKKPTLQTLPPEEPMINVFGGGGGAEKQNAFGKPDGMFANAHDPAYKAPIPDAYTQTLLNVLKATRPQDMPKDLLKRILDYTYSNFNIAMSVIEGVFGQSFQWNGGTASSKLAEVRKALGDYLDGYQRLSSDASKFIKGFVDLVEIPPPVPVDAKPKPTVKAEVETTKAPPSVPLPAPPKVTVDKTARKKRTIRRSQD